MAPADRRRPARVRNGAGYPWAQLGAVGLLSLNACLGDEASEPAPFPLDVGAGFVATVREGERLEIASGDGRVLLDGLAADEAAAAGPPLTGFAVRAGRPSYHTSFGAFEPDPETGAGWRVATRVRWQPGQTAAPVPSGASGGAGGGTDVGPTEQTGVLELLDAAGEPLGRVRFYPGEAGHLVASIEAATEDADRVSWGFRCAPSDHFIGLGAQSWDVDHRGQTVPCLVQEQGNGKLDTDEPDSSWPMVGRRHSSYAPIPELLSRRGYVLVADTPLPVTFALCSESESAARIELDLPARVHLFDGPSPAQALERASAVFGRPRMPPPVAFAPWLDAIFGSASAREVAAKLREHRVPSSVIWTADWRGGVSADDDYHPAGAWEVDRTLYPDVEQLADDLHAQGFHWHVSFAPFVYRDSAAWQETAARGWLVRRDDGSEYVLTGPLGADAGLLDVDHPEARAWAIGKMHEAIELGADGWMNDNGEWLPFDAVTAAGSGRNRHNEYPIEWQRIAREAIDEIDDGVERLFYSRSTWLRGAPLADVFWAGEQRTSFEEDDGLPTILPLGIGLGVTGTSTFGHDIAGAQASSNPGASRELFFRWTELGAWSPVMRTHHGAQPSLNWSWDRDGGTIAHFRRYAALHMSLVPYFQGLARVAADTGIPIWRALAIEFPEEERLWAVRDQVLVGRSVMVAPMTRAFARSRPVVMPAGRWYPWAEGAAIEGGDSIDAEADLGEIPVFARAGAIVPTYPPGVMTLVNGSLDVADTRVVGDDRVLLVFLGAAGAFEEEGGLRYVLRWLSAREITDPSLEWNGEPLLGCDDSIEPPCVERDEDGATAHTWGPGSLELSVLGAPVAQLDVEGGSTLRRMTIRLRW